MQNKALFIIISLFLLNTCVFGDYSISASDPLGPKMQKITHNYGEYRNDPGYKYHDGFDYQAKTGTKIFPVDSGTAYVSHEPEALRGKKVGWGNYVIVDHGNYETRYAHLSSIEVVDGQSVNTSTVLGLSGDLPPLAMPL